MATEVVKVIDPDQGTGHDYDSLFDWEAAQQGDLTGARNEIAVAKCRCTGGTADTTAIGTEGWTTSATQYIKIWTDPAESYRHNGTYQTGNKFRIDGDDYATIYNWADYISLIGIAMSSSAAASYGCLARATTGTITIENCIIKGGGAGVGIGWDFGQNYKIRNTIIFDFDTGLNIAGPAYVYNCTVQNCSGTGYNSLGGTILWKNCGAASCGTGFSGGTQTTCSSTTPTFVGAGADDFHLASNDTTWIAAATNLYNDANYPFQDDIDGQDRGGAAASWDIGADEYVSAVTDLSIFASECVGSEGVFG